MMFMVIVVSSLPELDFCILEFWLFIASQHSRAAGSVVEQGQLCYTAVEAIKTPSVSGYLHAHSLACIHTLLSFSPTKNDVYRP